MVDKIHIGSARLQRWALTLSQYDFTVVAKPGKLHTNADALTRQHDVPVNSNMPKFRLQTHQAVQTSDSAEKIYVVASVNVVATAEVAHSTVDLAVVRREQGRDTVVVKMKNFVESKEVPVGDTRKNLELMTKGCEIKDGILQLKKRGSALRRVVVPASLKQQFLELAHDNPCSGHFGVHHTKQRLQQVAYWKGLHVDVTEYCANCEVCALNKHYGKNLLAEMTPLQVPIQPFELVATDIVHLPESPEGYKYVLAFLSHLTKFLVAIPLKNIDAETVSDAFLNQFCKIFSFPQHLLSDKGSNFTSEHMQTILRECETNHITSVPYHHETNGGVERLFRTLRQGIKILARDTISDWYRSLCMFTIAYNSAEHSTTGASPYFVTFGREPRVPANVVTEVPLDFENFDLDSTPLLEPGCSILDFQARFSWLWDKIRERAEKSKQLMKKRADKVANVRSDSFKVGDIVILKASANLLGKYPKMSAHRGPAVIKAINYPNFLIPLKENGRVMDKPVHVNQLRKFMGKFKDSDFSDDLCSYCSHYHLPGRRTAKWIACDTCNRWFHTLCLTKPPKNQKDPYLCNFCSSS